LLIDNIKFVTLAVTIIGIIPLLGAAIGLMNIILVAVAERTREIGTRKALGATRQDIQRQFLIEAIVIYLMGGIVGIFLGIFASNAFRVYYALVVDWHGHYYLRNSWSYLLAFTLPLKPLSLTLLRLYDTSKKKFSAMIIMNYFFFHSPMLLSKHT
jgi:ABC-type antimicrobial peptide transport system permease subunit